MPIGPWELAIILVIVIIIFGAGKLPEIGGALGRGIKEFKESARDDDEHEEAQQQQYGHAHQPYHEPAQQYHAGPQHQPQYEPHPQQPHEPPRDPQGNAPEHHGSGEPARRDV